jgi:hypothetical protein
VRRALRGHLLAGIPYQQPAPCRGPELYVFPVREDLLNDAALHDNNDLSHGFPAYSGWSFAGAATKALRATREASTAHAASQEIRTIRSHLLRETGIKAKNRSASTPVVRASLPVVPCRLANLNRMFSTHSQMPAWPSRRTLSASKILQASRRSQVHLRLFRGRRQQERTTPAEKSAIEFFVRESGGHIVTACMGSKSAAPSACRAFLLSGRVQEMPELAADIHSRRKTVTSHASSTDAKLYVPHKSWP